MPHLERITIYPVKSLDGVDVPEAVVLPSGALDHDRRFALVDGDGRFLNGKRTASVHRVRSSLDIPSRILTLGLEGSGDRVQFSVDRDREALEAWLSRHIGVPARLMEDATRGYPDDTESPGPTLIGSATLRTVAGWFPGVEEAGCRRRFRANLEIGGVESFWEDRLYAEAGEVVPFRVGEVIFEGNNPCQRCVVPSRSPTDGNVTPDFARRFRERREASLPAWAARGRFDHFYRLAVNTRLSPGSGGTIRVGDPVQVLDARLAPR